MKPSMMCNWGPCWVKGALARCTGGSGMELLLLSRYVLQPIPQKGAYCKMAPLGAAILAAWLSNFITTRDTC